MKKVFYFLIIGFLLSLSCGKERELSLKEIEALKTGGAPVLEGTVRKPGGQEFADGKVGGIYYSSLTNDPKTFNTLTARDGDSRTVIDVLYDSLADYDPNKREWLPNLAAFKVETDEKNKKLDVIFTLRDDLYWSLAGSGKGVKVSSDDVVFWYDEIVGDKALQQPGYNSQFVDMEDGSVERISIEKIDDRSFVFHYPRIVADPILSSNMFFGPEYIFRKEKERGGTEALLDFWSIDTDPKTIPSLGEYHILEYTPGVRVVLKKNENYWKTDKKGVHLPYIEKIIYKIVPDRNTEYLLFLNGEKDAYKARPEDLEEMLSREKRNYTVYDGGASLNAGFLTFNQNPSNIDTKYYSWFVETKFRQAMSCLLNRKRIIKQVYRGLAEPALHFFATANPFYDESIKQKFTYDPDRAVRLLKEIGIEKNADGNMEDKKGNKIEFNLHVGIENNIGVDIMNIFSDECKKVGIKADVKPIDFQKLVDMIMNSYDWHAVFLYLGSNYWPTGGSNVWPSKGNFHIWRPLQEKPATEWEKRIDYLYNEGSYTIDRGKAVKIWNEYQRILLDQLPFIYLVHPLSFLGVRDRWDNVFYDTLNGLDTKYLFLKD